MSAQWAGAFRFPAGNPRKTKFEPQPKLALAEKAPVIGMLRRFVGGSFCVRAPAINADAVTLIRVEEVGFEVLPLRPLRARGVQVPLGEAMRSFGGFAADIFEGLLMRIRARNPSSFSVRFGAKSRSARRGGDQKEWVIVPGAGASELCGGSKPGFSLVS